ncbi:MAG: hypothetical protein OXC62_05865 [Aestuariivita sp.]|nr:hypothetical protein [Aestuariivita sp.]
MTKHEMIISGTLKTKEMLDFIQHYLRLFDLDSHIIKVHTTEVKLSLRGAPDLIDMLEIACWLGPENSQILSVNVIHN